MSTTMTFRGARRSVACLVAALVAALLLAACGSSSGTGTSSTGPSTTASSANQLQSRTKLAACLKQQGITPPRLRNGRGNGAPPTGTTPNGGPPPAGGPRFFGGRNLSAAQRQKLQQAFAKCGGARVGGPRRFDATASPAFRAALTKFVACVRTHGFDLPAPNTSGSGPIFDPRKVDQNDAKFVAASRMCQHLLQGVRPPGGPPPGGGGADRSGGPAS